MKNFVITSCIREPFYDKKADLLFNLVKSIKEKHKDCFIMVAEANKLEDRCQPYIDFAIIDHFFPNTPRHGNQECAKLMTSMKILQDMGKTWYYKLSYDFIYDDSNIQIFDNWQKKLTKIQK